MKHPQSAKGEVVLDRIPCVKAFQVVGDVERHGEAWALQLGEMELFRDLCHMRIQWDDQLRRFKVRPEAEVDVVPPDHPTEEKV